MPLISIIGAIFSLFLMFGRSIVGAPRHIIENVTLDHCFVRDDHSEKRARSSVAFSCPFLIALEYLGIFPAHGVDPMNAPAILTGSLDSGR
jgi:hypothetical protein